MKAQVSKVIVALMNPLYSPKSRRSRRHRIDTGYKDGHYDDPARNIFPPSKGWLMIKDISLKSGYQLGSLTDQIKKLSRLSLVERKRLSPKKAKQIKGTTKYFYRIPHTAEALMSLVDYLGDKGRLVKKSPHYVDLLGKSDYYNILRKHSKNVFIELDKKYKEAERAYDEYMRSIIDDDDLEWDPSENPFNVLIHNIEYIKQYESGMFNIENKEVSSKNGG